MKRALLLALVTLSAALVACEDTSKPAAQGAVAEADLAVPADFEEEAEKQITTANYKTELDTLEKEIAAE
jgi:hypothetical protein